ncbi:MAG: PH domain-containing protein [Candidatus Odinarchaeota archaeon]
MSDYKAIKGSDISPPPPSEPRIIRPSRNFLWKNYFVLILTYASFTVVMVVITVFFGWLLTATSIEREDIFLTIFTMMGLMYLGFCLLTLPPLFIGVTLYIRTMEFIVHGDEIVVHKGLVNKSEKHVPYRTVTNIDMRAGVFDRMFNIGTIEIQTAGGGGMSLDDTATEKLEGIKIYREVRDYIIAQLRQFQSSGTTAPQETELDAAASTNSVASELREIKVLLSKRLDDMEKRLKSLESRMK